MTKYLILDKSIIHGTSTAELCQSAKTHNIVLPETLLYECVTTGKQERDAMLDRCRNVLLAGAFFCPTLSSVIHAEARDLRPYGRLVDPEHSAAVRRTFQGNPRPYDPEGVERKSANERAFVDHIASNIKGCTEYFRTEKPEALQEGIEAWNDVDGSRPQRLRELVQFVDSANLHEAGNRLLPGMTQRPEQFCLSEEWVTWQLVRVSLT